MKKFALLLVLPLFMTTTACTTDIGANHYNTSSANQVSTAQKGTVISVRQVAVSSENNNAGTLLGAVAGGAAGSMIGGNDAVHVIGAVGGATLGGIAGNAAQSGLSKQGGYEYVVQLDNGNIVTVTQGTDVLINVGQKCLVLGGAQARVIPYNGI